MNVSPLHAPAVESTNPLDELYNPDCTPVVRDSKGKPQKYIRTMMEVDGVMVTARITVATGEIKPYKYPNKNDNNRKAKPTQEFIELNANRTFVGEGDILGYTPTWATIEAPASSVLPPKDAADKGAMRKSKPNPNGALLSEFGCISDALECFPELDNLLTGCANLDAQGNTRPMKTGLLFAMLRDLHDIDVETIKAYSPHLEYSDRHCYRLAQYLRVLSAAFDAVVYQREQAC